MPKPVLAEVYLQPAVTKRVPTTPGRDVVFNFGKAEIHDPRDMPFILRRDDVTIEIPARQMDWLPDWMNACSEQEPPRAKLVLPAGFKLGVHNRVWSLKERPPFLNEEGHPAEGPFPEGPKDSGWMFPTE